jgi:hypothetical protein
MFVEKVLSGKHVTLRRMPKEPKHDFKVGDKICVNLHHGKIEDAVVKAVINHLEATKLQVDAPVLTSRRWSTRRLCRIRTEYLLQWSSGQSEEAKAEWRRRHAPPPSC